MRPSFRRGTRPFSGVLADDGLSECCWAYFLIDFARLRFHCEVSQPILDCQRPQLPPTIAAHGTQGLSPTICLPKDCLGAFVATRSSCSPCLRVTFKENRSSFQSWQRSWLLSEPFFILFFYCHLWSIMVLFLIEKYLKICLLCFFVNWFFFRSTVYSTVLVKWDKKHRRLLDRWGEK